MSPRDGLQAAVALGRLVWLGQWSRILAPVGQALVARLVAAVVVGREGSKRSVVAAGSGRTVTTRWTLEGEQPRGRERGPRQRLVAVAVGTMAGAFKAVALKAPTDHRSLEIGWR